MTKIDIDSDNETDFSGSLAPSDLESYAVVSNVNDSRVQLKQVVDSEAPLSIEEIAKVRSEEKEWGSYRAREYKVNGSSVSVLRPPVLVSEIRDDDHKKKVLSVLQHREDGETDCYERLLVNMLREQEHIAKKFGLPEKGLYLSMKLNYIDDSNIMMDNFGNIFMQPMIRHIDSLKKQGASDAEVIIELSGHIFHEAVHQGEEGLGEALHAGKHSLGEVTTITAQLAYYLEKGYKGPKGYDISRSKQGLKKIKDGKDSTLDYDIAICVSAELLLRHIKEAYSEFSDDIEGMSPLDACEYIVFRIPSDKKAELIPCLKNAIAESADKAVFEGILKELKA